jgi:hypothetical protein
MVDESALEQMIGAYRLCGYPLALGVIGGLSLAARGARRRVL